LKKTIQKLEKEYCTVAQAAKSTGIEYHTLVNKFKRDETNQYEAIRTKWGWMISNKTVEKLKQ